MYLKKVENVGREIGEVGVVVVVVKFEMQTGYTHLG